MTLTGKQLDFKISEFQITLRALRKQRHLTLLEVGIGTDIDPAYICKLETGEKTNPSLKILLKLCHFYHCILIISNSKPVIFKIEATF